MVIAASSTRLELNEGLGERPVLDFAGRWVLGPVIALALFDGGFFARPSSHLPLKPLAGTEVRHETTQRARRSVGFRTSGSTSTGEHLTGTARAQGGQPRQVALLDQFEHGATAGRHMVDLVLHPVGTQGGRHIAPTDDGKPRPTVPGCGSRPPLPQCLRVRCAAVRSNRPATARPPPMDPGGPQGLGGTQQR